MNFKILLFWGFFSSFALFSGQNMEVIDIDSTKKNFYPADSLLNLNPKTDNIISQKTFQEGYQNKYKSKEYDYTATKPRESLWEKILQKIDDFLESIFGKINPNKPYQYAENIIKIIAVIVIGIAVYFLVKFLLNKNGNLFFSKKNKKVDIYAEEIQENIHEINFPEKISYYEQVKDFRSAVRYQFLYILKQLTDQHLIDWNPEKTNRDYIIEIQNLGLRDEFQEMVKIFDYVWYGKFEITEKYYWETKNKWKLKTKSNS